MERMPQHTWRVQNIPEGISGDDLIGMFHSDDRVNIEIKSLVPDVDNYDGTGTQTATFLFKAPVGTEPRLDTHHASNVSLEIDKEFHGFTPLNKVGVDVSAE